MIERIIAFSVLRPWPILVVAALATLGGWFAMTSSKLDAIPDLSDTQVIVFTEWMGQSPELVEDQVTYPVVSSLVSAPGVRAVRGFSMFGMSFVYVIFSDDTDLGEARNQVQAFLPGIQARLPRGAVATLGPDATGVGWAYQYALIDTSGAHDLAQLREYQDFTLKYALGSVPGVAEVATIGGYARELQVDADPVRMAQRGVTLGELADAMRKANGEVGGRLLEMSQREYYVRATGYLGSVQALADTVIRTQPGGSPLRISEVATVHEGPAQRRGTADWNGQGETVGGIVVVRAGENTLSVLDRVKRRIEELRPSLPKGMELHTAYDRTEIIHRSVQTLSQALIEEMTVVAIIILVFLLHVRSTLVSVIVLPAAVLLAFIPMRLLGVSSNIMSLGGIALAIGDLVDAAIVLVDDAHKKIEHLPHPYTEKQRIEAILQATQGVGRPLFFSLMLLFVSFLPVFALEGQAAKLFEPLAYTKTFSMGFAALLSITAAPALLRLLVKGRIRRESEHPLSRWLIKVYEPFAWVALHNPKTTIALGLCAVLSAVPLSLKLGNEFMPAINEGDMLYMPTTWNGIAIDEAHRSLQIQDRIIAQFPEVLSVFGKAGRAETSTDPAPLSMVETVIRLKPQDQWRHVPQERWWTDGKGRRSEWLPQRWVTPFERVWPAQRPLTLAELQAQFQAAVDLPGWTNAWTMPIKTRIDMLSTGIRTPVGIKVYGKDIAAIDEAGARLEGLLRDRPGTRSVFAERNRGGYYVDLEPDREKLARFGLTVADLQEAVATASGGERTGTVVQGRVRIPIQLRYALGFRQTPEDLAKIVLPVGNADAWQAAAPRQPSASAPVNPGAAMGAMAPAPSGPAAAPQVSGNTGLPPPVVHLGDVAKVVVREGAPMLKDENGSLVGYVFVDVDTERVDIGSWVDGAKIVVAKAGMAAGIRLEWTGQYEFLVKMQERMRIVVPVTLVLIFLLLYLNFGNIAQPLLVLGTVPFALVGSIWLLWAMKFNLSTAVWVGLIALVGVAAETGIVMLMYLDEAYLRRLAAGAIRSKADIQDAALEGAVQRVRPKLMTVAVNIIGMTPLLWAEGTGSEVMKRIAAPMVGGLITSTFLTLEIIPVVYVAWRWSQWRRAQREVAHG